MIYKRRQFLKSSTLLGTAMMLEGMPMLAATNSMKDLHISCQHYTWFTYYRREGKEWEKDPQAAMKAVQDAGLQGYEPSFKDVPHVEAIKPQLAKHKLQAKSMYVNSWLHEADNQEKSIGEVMTIARQAKKAGVEIVVTNPSPIQWGKAEDKTDKQIILQAKALNKLGSALRKIGMTLAYHNHDMEMRQSAREFHHMMLNTDPENVRLCLDAHWIYRGSGNSQVALFDIISLYADRIVELHLRQSHDGIWSEVFGEGDVDYPRLVAFLVEKNIQPHLVLEQAIEEGTPHTMNTLEAIRKSVNYIHQLFG